MLRTAGKHKKNNKKGRNIPLHEVATVTVLFVLSAVLAISDLRASEPVLPASDRVPQEDENQDKFLILQTNLHPPYQELQNGLLGGYSISILNCAFERIGVGYGLAVAPRQRNRDMVRSGRADGFFLARISESMDEYAVATYPLALEKWVWVSPANKVVSFDANRLPKPGELTSVAAILGSNEAEWLSEQGYQDVTRVPSIASLVSQVAAGRVDFALVDKHSFEIARNNLALGAEQFRVQFERYSPLVVYFSKRYVEAYPDLLGKLNNVLEFCETRPMHLEPWERDAIERIQLPIVRQFAKSKDLIRNVRAVLGTEHIPSDQKRVIDEEWTAMSRRGLASSMAQNILDNILSDYLRTFKNTAGAQVAEVFVFDLAGQVIGMNRLTSDFDQSDEAQYQMTDSINRDHALIADIRYDASTRAFLSQITVPIIDPESGRTLAALTVGLDVSAAMRPES